MCAYTPSYRYTCETALTHPWITRNLNDEIPKCMAEQNLIHYELEQKLLKVS